MDKDKECSELISKVIPALDGQLSDDELKDFYKRLECNGWCLEQYNIEKAFKAFLANKIERKECSKDLVECIKDKIKVATA